MMFLSAPDATKFTEVWKKIIDAFKTVIDTILGILGIEREEKPAE